MAHVRVLGIDLAKQIFAAVVMRMTAAASCCGSVCPRGALMSCIAQLSPRRDRDGEVHRDVI